ncbi:MAG: hypothetical protein F6K55_06800 [Moorea sp. SIO4A3]|nr:hypothetical protein [Moorena sp. SIO4A3]
MGIGNLEGGWEVWGDGEMGRWGDGEMGRCRWNRHLACGRIGILPVVE